MNDLKLENDHTVYVCRGCLSVDRKLELLNRNIDLYYMLLGLQKPKDSKCFNVLLCWECTAFLKRVRAFQTQIKKAQYEIENYLLNEPLHSKPLEALSSLTVTNKYDFDVLLEEGPELDIKIEPPVFHDDLKDLDIKHELLTDQVSEDISDREDTEFTIDNIKTETDKKNTKHKDRLSDVIVRDFDVNKADDYISEVSYSLKEIAMYRKEKKEWFKSAMSSRLKARIKKIFDSRNNDTKKTGNNKYNCNKCNTSLESLESLRSHLDDHCIVMYRCDLCKKHFLLRSALGLHFKSCHSKIYTCKDCGIQFSGLRDYFFHNRQLHKFHVCDICSKTFHKKRSIERHMRLTHLPSKCQICQRIFPTNNKYRRHMTNYHTQPAAGPALELCYCVECDRQFPHLLAYKRHLRTAVLHNPKKPISIPCPVCGKIFSRKTYMRNHYQLVHVKKSNHYCEICDKYYINGFSLRQHKQYVHVKSEKPKDKICDICGRGFNANRTLVNHRRTHTGERPYQCSHCPAAFAQLTAKKSHERTQHKSLIEN